jgi:hypothetical protein
MTSYAAPIRDMQFLLHEVFEIERYSNLPGFSEASADVVDAILEEGAKFSAEVLHPLNHSGGREGCRCLADGSVTTPKGFKEAYAAYRDGGWQGLGADPEWGGQGLPYVVGIAVSEMMSAANMAFSMYPGLARGAAAAIEAHGTAEQKAFYLPKMIAGEWAGTMNLTEPHCGTDLGLLRTRAVRQPDGTYKITGQKIFISAGEHDLAPNIIHLVLARIEGAPEGVKGISLFIVPKVLAGKDGALLDRNGVSCGKIEEKMGIHANSTCVMNFDEATGFLLGEENKGLKAMFTMMNEARLGVAMQGLAISEIAYQNAAAYAKDRLQGRSLTGPKFPEKPADPIIVHPDVRRMLLDQKAVVEGGRAWIYGAGLKADLLRRSQDASERQEADDYLSLMTPVLKAFLTEKGYLHASTAQQVLGGHGYVAEWGMEQFVRDARIAMIYEGANGIQALDLVGRKLMKDGGRAWTVWFAEIDRLIADGAGVDALKPFLDGLSSAKADLSEGIQWMAAHAMADYDNAGAASMDLLHLFALTAIAEGWARMARVAVEKEAGGDPFYRNKLVTGRYFLARVLPDAKAHLAKLKSGAAPVMALPAEAF